MFCPHEMEFPFPWIEIAINLYTWSQFVFIIRICHLDLVQVNYVYVALTMVHIELNFEKMCKSLLDNAPNEVDGCIIQKRFAHFFIFWPSNTLAWHWTYLEFRSLFKDCMNRLLFGMMNSAMTFDFPFFN